MMIRTLPACLLLLAGASIAQAQFADQVVYQQNLPATGLYNDPAAALGKPTTQFLGGTTPNSSDLTYRTTLATGAYNTTPAGGKTLVTIGSGSELVVSFANPVLDDPANPFGMDLIVFGNSFFSSVGYVEPGTSPLNVGLGTLITEPGVKVEVAKTYIGADTVWTRLTPNADNLFPTQGYSWTGSSWGGEMDFTKPVDPSLTASSFNGKTLAQGIALYNGSGGGTAYDLTGTGLDWIQYVRFSQDGAFPGFAGEIDAVADVTAVPEPAGLSLLAVGAGLALRRRRASNRA